MFSRSELGSYSHFRFCIFFRILKLVELKKKNIRDWYSEFRLVRILEALFSVKREDLNQL